MKRQLHFAAPFVLVAGCTKEQPKPRPEPPNENPPALRRDAGPAPVAVAPARAWAPHTQHPLLVPDPSSTKTHDGHTIQLESDLSCLQYFHVQCDPGEKCNPPAPEPVPCPSAIRPRLALETLPTRSDSGRCWWNDIEVTCPAGMVKGNLALPETREQGTIYLHEGELLCFDDPPYDPCPPEVDCNPPPPQQVPCPRELLPTLIGDAQPNRTDGDRCFWDDIEVRCPK